MPAVFGVVPIFFLFVTSTTNRKKHALLLTQSLLAMYNHGIWIDSISHDIALYCIYCVMMPKYPYFKIAISKDQRTILSPKSLTGRLSLTRTVRSQSGFFPEVSTHLCAVNGGPGIGSLAAWCIIIAVNGVRASRGNLCHHLCRRSRLSLCRQQGRKRRLSALSCNIGPGKLSEILSVHEPGNSTQICRVVCINRRQSLVYVAKQILRNLFKQ